IKSASIGYNPVFADQEAGCRLKTSILLAVVASTKSNLCFNRITTISEAENLFGQPFARAAHSGCDAADDFVAAFAVAFGMPQIVLDGRQTFLQRADHAHAARFHKGAVVIGLGVLQRAAIGQSG